jgi:hypothetical protein
MLGGVLCQLCWHSGVFLNCPCLLALFVVGRILLGSVDQSADCCSNRDAQDINCKIRIPGRGTCCVHSSVCHLLHL